jgi:hypothetical protein
MKEETVPLAKSPDAWRRTAIGLKRSANIIFEQWYGIFKRLDGGQIASATTQEAGDLNLLFPTYLLLVGLSLENALKGLMIAKNPSLVESKIKWKIKGGSHNLIELYKQTGLSAKTDEIELLDALTRAVLWAGRYPVPKKHNNKSEFTIFLGPYFRNV